MMCVIAGAQKADQVFLPVLENAMKAQKLRTTLGVFDRSKFFFNLPSSLVECIEAVSPYTKILPFAHHQELPPL